MVCRVLCHCQALGLIRNKSSNISNLYLYDQTISGWKLFQNTLELSTALTRLIHSAGYNTATLSQLLCTGFNSVVSEVVLGRTENRWQPYWIFQRLIEVLFLFGHYFQWPMGAASAHLRWGFKAHQSGPGQAFSTSPLQWRTVVWE